jgi:hypothetical protein
MKIEMIEAIITAIGGTAILLAVVAWLIRSLIGQYLSKDLENYKEKLRSQSAVELERLKGELAMNAAAHQIRFSKLHEKQATLIEELYLGVDRLDQLSKLLIGLFAQDKPINEKIPRVHEILEEYLEYNSKFYKNKLFFSPEINSLLEAYRYTVIEPAMVLLEDISDTEKQDFIDGYIDNNEHNIKKIDDLKAAIESMFRKLLGVI